VAAIVPLEDDARPGRRTEAIKELAARVCSRLDPEGRLVAAVSTVCRSASDYVRAYKEACQVASCLEAFCPPDTAVLAADDLGAARLFLFSTDPDEAVRFAHDTLGALLDPELDGD